MQLFRKLRLLPVLAVSALPLSAAGWLVFDMTHFYESVKHTKELIAMAKKAAETYEKITEHYDHARYMSKRIQNMGRYKTASLTTVWRGMKTPKDGYGRAGRWMDGINKGMDTYGSWERATTKAILYPNMARLPQSQRDKMEVEITGIELADGTGISAMDTIGRIRNAGPDTEKLIDQLTEDAMSSDPDMHTEAAQLNKANIIAAVQTKAMQDQNKLLVASAEIALLRLRQEREAQAYAMAQQTAFREYGKEILEATNTGWSDRMRNPLQ